jgi:radical SAM PhpK family P-methyltransferase
MNQRKGLDCIVIGHNDVDFHSVENDMARVQNHSGAYLDLKMNTVDYHGERMPYMTLLNRILEKATGVTNNLHLCELPHLGSVYLKSFLCRRGFNVEVVNFFNAEKERLVELLDQGANAVAITTTLYVHHQPIADIIKFIRRYNTTAKIIVGGPYVFNLCSTVDVTGRDFLLREIGADFYVNDSQGELTLAQVVGELRNSKNRNFSSIPNLLYSEGNKYISTERAVENNDMNENSIDWRYFDPDFCSPTVQMRTARSCAFKCSFCRYPSTAGPLNLASIDVIERELSLLHQMGAKNVVFIDDTFNVPLQRFKDICRMIIKNKYDFNWFSFFRCSNSDDEAFDLMMESGCRGVFLGIESGDANILKLMNKAANVDRYQYGIEKLKKRGILTFASVIIGFPGETDESVHNTMKLLEEASPTFYRAELYYHYTNVPIHSRAEVLGINGAGYSWKHNTMDWRGASEHVKEMYRTLKGPTILPSYMFDFWSIPYLIGKGMTVDQLIGFTTQAQQMLLRGIEESSPDIDEQEAALVSTLGSFNTNSNGDMPPRI